MRLVATMVYLRKVGKLLTDSERDAAESEIAAAPKRWPVIAGTGGIRKARARRGSLGKSGGARVIYYFQRDAATVYLLTVYAKSERDDLSDEDKRIWRRFVKRIETSDDR